ncbi:hypothetical protein KI387_035955, partial [Taxus chinensis]
MGFSDQNVPPADEGDDIHPGGHVLDPAVPYIGYATIFDLLRGIGGVNANGIWCGDGRAEIPQCQPELWRDVPTSSRGDKASSITDG